MVNPMPRARVRCRTDGNHAEIREAFRQLGCSVADTSRLGDGFPDLLVGYRRRNLLVEVKDGSKSPSRRKLSDDEAKFHAEWRGQVAVVETVDDVARLIAAHNPMLWE